MANDNNNIQPLEDDSQIVLYQPDESSWLLIQLTQILHYFSQLAQILRQLKNKKIQLSQNLR